MAEINAFTGDMYDKHNRCYQIMKYPSEISELSNNQIKTVVLHHNRKCSDTTDDCLDYVIGMFRNLQQANESNELLSYQSNLNIFKDNVVLKLSCSDLLDLLSFLRYISETDNLNILKVNLNILKDNVVLKFRCSDLLSFLLYISETDNWGGGGLRWKG